MNEVQKLTQRAKLHEGRGNLSSISYQLSSALSSISCQLSSWRKRAAFTLIEVNLALFIMAGGVLAMISLYSLGFRESKQSREDVAAAAIADEILNPLVVALSSRTLKWSDWKNLNFSRASSGSRTGFSISGLQVMPGNSGAGSGWLSYIEKKGSKTEAVY